ncbi:MAG: hypothetical protein WBG76_14610 [Ornithinimicrobium sp.]
MAFLDADPDFYDDAWQVVSDAADILGPAEVTAEVVVCDSGPWRLYRTSAVLPHTGWKVHVACVPDRAAHVVDVAIRAGLENGLTCKHLRSCRLVRSSQGKYAEPTSAGKVVTLYPTNEVDLERIVHRLTDLLAGEAGARILSDIPVNGAPVSLRYGAFIGAYRLDQRGQLSVGLVTEGGGSSAPDDRSPHSAGRSDNEIPPFVRAMRDEAQRRDAAAVLPVRDVGLLHRSNAGGVYAATWEEDGSLVVLKEARRHTGFDLAGSDAVTRLRQERRALVRLAGTGVVPQVRAYVEAGDSEFLVMERIEGNVLTAGMATGHPGAVPGADGTSYRRWVDHVVAGTSKALDAVHARGVAHLDVHPGNIIECGGRIVLLDLESSAVDGHVVARGVGTVLSTTSDDVSPAADRTALGRMRALLLNPQYSLTARRPDLASELVAAGEADLETESVKAPTAPRYGGPPDVSRIVAGLHVAATPRRTDRLFPSDVTGFGVPGGGLVMLHGASGVLGVLAVGERRVPDAWREWLVGGASRAPNLALGLGDGAEGIALSVARLGELAAARSIIDRWGGRMSRVPWWARGTAGQCVAYAELSLLLDDPYLMNSARDLAEACLTSLERDTPAPGHRAGLLEGWSGVGLALLRVAECLAVTRTGSGELGSRLWVGARRALDLEIASVRRVGGTWMTAAGARLMPYLGTGSAALGILARALGGKTSTLGIGPGSPLVAETGSLDEAVEGVLGAVRLRSVACSGLLHGRAGLLLALGCLAPADPVVDLHRHRLGWHVVPVGSSSRNGHRLAAHADFLLGDQNFRASADIGSGAAGVLLAVDADIAVAWARTASMLCFPRSATG